MANALHNDPLVQQQDANAMKRHMRILRSATMKKEVAEAMHGDHDHDDEGGDANDARISLHSCIIVGQRYYNWD